MERDAVVIAPLVGDRYERLQKIISKSPEAAGMTFITAKERPDLYGSGHAQEEDFKLLASMIKPKTVMPVHCSEKMAKTLNALARSEGYQTFSRHVRNGETLFVSALEGISLVDSKEPEWYGLIHKKNKYGDIETAVKKIPDNGFSFSPSKSFEEKRREADMKLAEYKMHKNVAVISAARRNGNDR